MSEAKNITPETERIVTVYNVVTSRLARIGKLPYQPRDRNARGYPKILGPFIPITFEAVMDTAITLEPRDWFLGEKFDGGNICFEDLHPADQEKIIKALKSFETDSNEPKQLEKKCLVCWELFEELFERQKKIVHEDALFKQFLKDRDAK